MTAVLIANATLLFHLFAAVVFLVLLVVVARLWPQVGVGLLFAVLAAGPYLRDPRLTVTVGVAGLEVAPLDALAVALLGAAVVQLVARGPADVTRVGVVIVVLGGLLAVNLLRGVAAYGLQPAVNESRQWLYLIATISYGAVLPLRNGRLWRRIGIATCGWLALVAAVSLPATGLQPATALVVVNGDLIDGRPVTAAGALVLADGLLLALAWRRRSRLLAAVAVAALGGAALLLQHRTVWLAAAAGLVLVAVVALRAGGRARLGTVLAFGSVLAATVSAFLTGLAQRSVVATSAENVTAADNTFTWRVAGWRPLLQDRTEPLQLLIGDPFGTGFRRVVSGQLVTVSPHSHYVETFLRFGAVGIGLSVVLATLAWRAGPAVAAAMDVPAAIPRGVLIMAVVYGITYRLDPLQGLLIGSLLGLASRPPTAPDPRPVRPRSALVRSGAA